MAHNFTQCLSKIASTSIKKTFQREAIQFEKHTLKNLLALKWQFEELNLNKENVTIVSFDIKDMYPQCHFKAVGDAVKHYATILSDLKQEHINKCLDILWFSMGNTIVTFQDKYNKYGVDANPNRHGLTIGGFESAFLADLEASYIFDNLNYLLERHMYFIGTYRDDELLVSCGRKTHDWLTQWLATFQKGVDRLLKTQDIQFTMEIWSSGKASRPLPETLTSVPSRGQFHRISITINRESSFPYLDIKLSWNEDDCLNFNIHKKPNKLVKYLNTHSHHYCHHNPLSSLVWNYNLHY